MENEFFKEIGFDPKKLDENTNIIYGGGRGKSYYPFFRKHNLIGVSVEELEVRLNQIINDKSLEENELNLAKSLLDNLKMFE